jgi:hypothetical protein
MLCLLVSQRDQEDRARCLVTENQVMNLIPSGTGQEMLPEKMCQDQHHRVHLMVLDWEDQTRGLVMDLDSIQMCLGGTGRAMFLAMHCKSLNLMSILVQMDLVAQSRSPVMVSHKQKQNPDGIGLEMFQETVFLVLKQAVLMVLLTNQVGQAGCHERFPMMGQKIQLWLGIGRLLGNKYLPQSQLVHLMDQGCPKDLTKCCLMELAVTQTHQDGIGQEVNLGSSSLAQTQCPPLNLQDLEGLKVCQGMQASQKKMVPVLTGPERALLMV